MAIDVYISIYMAIDVYIIALVAEWQRVRLRVRMVKVRLSLWAIF